MRVGKPEPYAPVKDFDDWDFTFEGYAGTLDPTFRAKLKKSETITNSGDGDSTTRTAVCNIAVLLHDARTEWSTDSGEKSWKQRFRSLQTTVPDVRNVRSGRQHGLFVQIMTLKFGSKIEDMEDRLTEFLELVRRYDEANGTDPPIKCKRRALSRTRLSLLKHISSCMLVNWETNELRKGTEKSTSKMIEISESVNSKQVDDWNPSSNTSAQQPNSSQVNMIGSANEELLDVFTGKQPETSVHGELGRSVLFTD